MAQEQTGTISRRDMACDGVGGTAKRMADLSIKQGKISIQEAKDSMNGIQHHKNTKYILVKPEECSNAKQEIEDMNKILCPVKGTLQIHHVAAVEKGKVRTMTTSCYCEDCLDGRIHRDFNEGLIVKEIRKNHSFTGKQSKDRFNCHERQYPAGKLHS